MFLETRKQSVEVQAETEQAAIAQIKLWHKTGKLSPGMLCGTDFDVLDVNPIEEDALERFEIFDEPAIFTEMPARVVDKCPGIDRLYRYELRHGDDDSRPLSVERRVIVNYFGTVFTAYPLLKDDENARPVGDDDWGFLSDQEACTPERFAAEMLANDKSPPICELEILQLNRASALYVFLDYNSIQEMGGKLNASNYHSVYKGVLTHRDGIDLDNIYARFNVQIPPDYKGHALSVSDIIVIRQGNAQTAHFVDSYGFKELPDFFDVPEQDAEKRKNGKREKGRNSGAQGAR